MEKKRILIVGLIGLLLAIGLVLIGCYKDECPGNGQCIVFIEQGPNGLYIDKEQPQSTCGRGNKTDKYGNRTVGCAVDDNIHDYKRTYGAHGCSCE